MPKRYTIDKNVPMVKPYTPRGRYFTPALDRFRFDDMLVGDSILLVEPDEPDGLVDRANRRYAPKRYAIRKTPEGFRIWRVE